MLAFVRLGLWQLSRADEAAALQAQMETRVRDAPVTLDARTAAADAHALLWRRVELRGQWDDTHQVLLDNQVSQGRAGYFVYTPLRLAGCDCAVLVNRGWIVGGATRQDLPDVGIVAGKAMVHGVAAPLPPTALDRAADAEAVAPGLRRVQRVDVSDLSQWLGVRLLPLAVLLDAEERDGFRREWKPPPLRADRHMAYAVQWFLFALVALGIALRMNSRRR